MNSLKHEMRQMFDNSRSLNIFDDTVLLEDGLLERIVHLSILNPGVFPSQKWTALAVKSSMSKQKLKGMCGGDEIISESALCLIILKEKELSASDPYAVKIDHELLKMSVMYATKYYAVDSHVIETFDTETINKYFSISESLDIEMIICLGYFQIYNPAISKTNLKSYSQIIREV